MYQIEIPIIEFEERGFHIIGHRKLTVCKACYEKNTSPRKSP